MICDIKDCGMWDKCEIKEVAHRCPTFTREKDHLKYQDRIHFKEKRKQHFKS